MGNQNKYLTRREAMGLLAASGVALAQGTASPAIRTVLGDVSPESLAGGATLFHEHMSLSPDFLPKFMSLLTSRPPTAAPAPHPGETYFLRDLDLMTEELRAASKEGVACLVD